MKQEYTNLHISTDKINNILINFKLPINKCAKCGVSFSILGVIEYTTVYDEKQQFNSFMQYGSYYCPYCGEKNNIKDLEL